MTTPRIPSGFQDGETIVFHGDSLTHAGLYFYHLEAILRCRHPEWDFAFVNAGVSGGSAEGGLRRLDWDVLPHRPSRVFVMFGMNDINRGLYAADKTDSASLAERQVRLDAFREALGETCDRLAAAGAKVFVLSPSAYDQYSELAEPKLATCNDGLAQAAKVSQALAAERRLSSFDLHSPLTEIIRNNPELKMAQDRVHMAPVGHLCLAYFLARRLGVEGPLERLRRDVQDGLRWRCQPAALPLPRFPETAQADTLVPLTQELNQWPLAVSGLAAGTYALAIDGDEVGRFGHAVLAEGINLATLDTPWLAQAERIWADILEKRAIELKLRDMIFVERCARGAKIDLTDRAALDKYLDNGIATFGPYYAQTFGDYKRYRDLRPAMRAEADSLRQAMRKTQPPAARELSLIRVG